jgi:hypothetical protein
MLKIFIQIIKNVHNKILNILFISKKIEETKQCYVAGPHVWASRAAATKQARTAANAI